MSKRKRETIAVFAKRAGVSKRTIERDLASGLPHITDGDGRVMIEPHAGLAWRAANRATEAPASPLSDARARREQAAAGLEELKLARIQGRTMLVEEHERLLFDGFARVAAHLNNVANRLAPVMVNVPTTEEAFAKINAVVNEIREELRRADDVPRSLDDDRHAAKPARRKALH